MQDNKRKTYEKPVLVRAGSLPQVTGQPPPNCSIDPKECLS